MARKQTIELPCTFGNFSGGDQKDSISVAIANGKITPDLAEQFFAGTQLEVTLSKDPNAADDVAGQQKLQDEEPESVSAVAEARSYRRSDKFTTVTLGFAIDGLDDQENDLHQLKRSSGKIQATRVGDIERKPPGRKPREE